jgi:hypothetical protein
MPFVITDEELDRGFSILEECLAQVCAGKVGAGR